LRPKHVEWPCRNKSCTVLHQVGVSFDLYYDARKGPNKEMRWLTYNDNTCTSGRCTSFKTPDDGRLRPKHVEWPCINKTCTVLYQVGVSFDLKKIVSAWNQTSISRSSDSQIFHYKSATRGPSISTFFLNSYDWWLIWGVALQAGGIDRDTALGWIVCLSLNAYCIPSRVCLW